MFISGVDNWAIIFLGLELLLGVSISYINNW